MNSNSISYSINLESQGGPRMPIAPRAWGPNIWDTLHFISLGYPEDNPPVPVQNAARQFLEALPFLLPCVFCRVHLAEVYQTTMPLTPLVFSSKQALGTYVVNLRDHIHQKHVCPKCRHKTHSFHHDVEHRLLPERHGRCEAFWWTVWMVAALVIGGRALFSASKKYRGSPSMSSIL